MGRGSLTGGSGDSETGLIGGGTVGRVLSKLSGVGKVVSKNLTL